MLLIDPTKTRVTTKRTEYGKNIHTREHFDGTVDVNVEVKSLKLSLTSGAPPDRQLVEAVHELEAATKEWRIAKHSREPRWTAHVRRRLTVANERLLEVQ